jgi:predicted esterase
MRTLPFIATMPALRNRTLAVTLGGLLAACSAGGDSTDSSGEEPADTVGAAGTASGGQDAAAQAAGSSTGMGTTGTGTGTAGTGGSGASGTGSSSGAGGLPEAVNVVCNPIAAGKSSVTVNGTTRAFEVQMPANTSQIALLFLWHGWMQAPTDFANTVVYNVQSGQWVPFDPNAFPMPLMIVTPYDTKMIPPFGLDWDIVSGATDFPFFEGMLKCIDEQFSLDKTRIYSFGFSAGAVFTDLLSAQYPHLFAATISESGAWFNDSTQWSDVSVPIIQWKWPAFDPADHGNVLLTHGGSGDYATVISLESTNQKALPFLHDNGRTVMECAHTFGHTLDPDLTQSMYYDYMWDHQLGGPPLSGMVPGFPTQANPVGATACTFHPYP